MATTHATLLACCCARCCRFSQGLGMTLVAKSDQSTGNHHFASYVLQASTVTPYLESGPGAP